MEGLRTYCRVACVFMMATACSWHMAALRRIGAEPPGANEFAGVTGFITKLRDALIWPALGLGGLALIVAGGFFFTGNPRAGQWIGGVAIGCGILMFAPGIMA